MPTGSTTTPVTQTADDTVQQSLYPNGVVIDNVYIFRPGVCILPVAEDPPTDPDQLKNWSPVVKLQLHAPYRQRTVNYDAVKQNNPPVMPTPGDVGAFVFTGGIMTFNNSLNATFSNYDWHCTATFTTVENCVSRPQDGFVLGVPPYLPGFGTELQNAQQYGLQPPADGIGAVAQAGAYALIGNNQANQVVFGGAQTGWGYNTPSFYSGVFLNPTLINAGPTLPANQSQNTPTTGG